MTSISRAHENVDCVFRQALLCAERSEPRTFSQFEDEIWSLLLGLGCALVTLFLTHAAQRSRPSEYIHNAKRHRIHGERATWLGTRFGKVLFERPVGRRVGCGPGKTDLLVDRELGVCSGFSLGVVTGMVRLCAQMAFASARGTFREFHEWAPSSRAVLRMVDATGKEARTFLDQAPAPEGDGSVLVIQADAKGAPMISEQEYGLRCQPHRVRDEGQTRRHRRRDAREQRVRPRRTKGKKSKNAKMAVVGVIYTLAPSPDGMEGPVNKRLCATFESHDALFRQLRHQADKRGYGSKDTLFLGDGSEHIWYGQAKYFPKATVCLDWIHAVEKLWSAGQALFQEGSRELADWVRHKEDALHRGEVKNVISELTTARHGIPKVGPGNKGRRARLEETIEYYEKNQERMRYDELRARDLDIGTGAVEGAVRNLVGLRFDGPGMRWGRPRSEYILQLRCVLLNGQWQDFKTFLTSHEQLVLPSQPMKAIPHTAKAAA